MCRLLSLFHGMSILVQDLESEVLCLLRRSGGEVTLQELYITLASKVPSSYPVYLAIKSLESKGKIAVKVNGSQMKITLTK